MAVSRRTKCSRVKGTLPPRREAFTPAGPKNSGTYMKILAPFSAKYYRPQCMLLRRHLCSTRGEIIQYAALYIAKALFCTCRLVDSGSRGLDDGRSCGD